MEASIFRKKFNGFTTPNTYCNFTPLSEKSGVYLLVNRLIDTHEYKLMYVVLYIGSAKNIKNRVRGHNLMRTLRNLHGDVVPYFKEYVDYIEQEKKLIKEFNPKYNKQYTNHA